MKSTNILNIYIYIIKKKKRAQLHEMNPEHTRTHTSEYKRNSYVLNYRSQSGGRISKQTWAHDPVIIINLLVIIFHIKIFSFQLLAYKLVCR